jgi:hypothetical protein
MTFHQKRTARKRLPEQDCKGCQDKAARIIVKEG